MASAGDSNGPDSIPQRRSEALGSRVRMLPPVPRAPTDSHLPSSLVDSHHPPVVNTNLTVVVPDVRDQSPPLQRGTTFRSQVSPNGRSSRSTLVSQRSRTDSAGASPTSTRSSVGSPTDGSPSRPRASSTSAASTSTSSALPRQAGAPASVDASDSQSEGRVSEFSSLTRRFGQAGNSSPSSNARSGTGHAASLLPGASSRERAVTSGTATSSVRATSSTTSLRTSASSSSVRASSVVSSAQASAATSSVTSSLRAGTASSALRTSSSSIRGNPTGQTTTGRTLTSNSTAAGRQNLSSSSLVKSPGVSATGAGRARSGSASERGDVKGAPLSRTGVTGRVSSSYGGGGGTRLASGKEDIRKGKTVAKGLSVKVAGNTPLEPDQIAPPAFDKVKVLQEENEDLRRKLVAMEATQAAMAENPTAFEHWKFHLLRTQNAQLEDQLLVATTSLQDFGELKSQLSATAMELQQMVSRLKTFEQVQEPKVVSSSRLPSSAATASSLRRTLSAATSSSEVPSSTARRLSAPSRSTPSSPSLRSTSPASSTSRLATNSPRPASPSARTPGTVPRSGAGTSQKTESRTSRPMATPSRSPVTGTNRSPVTGKATPTVRGSNSAEPSSSAQRLANLSAEPASASDVTRAVKLAVPQEWVNNIESLAQEVVRKLAQNGSHVAESAEERELSAVGPPQISEKGGGFRVVFLPSSKNPFFLHTTEEVDVNGVGNGNNSSTLQEGAVLDLVRLRILEAQLGGLHPRLLRIIELLNSLLLPCLPSETIDAVEQEFRGVDVALNNASNALGQLCALVPFLCSLGGQGPSISAQIRSAVARPVDAGHHADSKQDESEVDEIPMAEPVGNGKVLKSAKVFESKQSEIESLEGMIRNLLQTQESMKESDEERLRVMLQWTRKLDLSWRNEMRALEDEIAFYRGCHAVNAAHVERITQLARSALEAVLEDAVKIIASSAVAIQQVLTALHRSHGSASEEADKQVLLQLQAAAPSLRLFVEMLPVSLKTVLESGDMSFPVAQDKANVVMSSLEQEYKDRLQAVFESLQAKRGEAYRQRSSTGPASTSIVLSSGILTNQELKGGMEETQDIRLGSSDSNGSSKPLA